MRLPDDPEVDNRIRALTISSVPRAWGSDDLSTFLASVGWTNLDQLTRRGKKWYGRAKPSDDHIRQSSWQYQVQLSDAQPAWSIHVQVSVPGPRPVSWNIQAPRRLRSVVGSVGPDVSLSQTDPVGPVIKLAPTMTLLPLLIRKAVSVSALPVGERLWLLLLLILNLNLLKRKLRLPVLQENGMVSILLPGPLLLRLKRFAPLNLVTTITSSIPMLLFITIGIKGPDNPTCYQLL